MRVLALCAGAAVMSGCSLFWGLDGLEGGHCAGGCEDGGSALASGGDEGPGGADGSPSPDASLGADVLGAADSRETGGEVDALAGDETDAPACTPPTPASLDDCTGLLGMPAPPVIDGVLDCGVPLWVMPMVGWDGSGSVPAGVQTTIAAAFRPGGLYLFVRVTGAGAHRYPAPSGTGPWCGDAVELFVDDDGRYASAPAYDNPGTMQFIAVAPPDSATSSTVGETFRDASDNGPWAGQFVSVRTSDGFDLEAFVTAADLGLATWSLSKSGHVGLDVAVDLGDPGGQPAGCPLLGQYDLSLPLTDAACSKAACNVSEFCNPQLQ